jgi:hypothetical protein
MRYRRQAGRDQVRAGGEYDERATAEQCGQAALRTSRAGALAQNVNASTCGNVWSIPAIYRRPETKTGGNRCHL